MDETFTTKEKQKIEADMQDIYAWQRSAQAIREERERLEKEKGRRDGLIADYVLTPLWNAFRTLRGVKNLVMLLVISAVIFLPAKYILFHYLFVNTPIDPPDPITQLLSIATILLVAPYAPWYWLWSLVPMLVIAGSFTGCYFGDYPHGVGYDNWPAISLVFLLWGLYGLVKGIHHEVTWLRESYNDDPHHHTMEHPYLFMGAAVGQHYVLKNTLYKKD